MVAAKAANLKVKRKELGENRTLSATGRPFSCKIGWWMPFAKREQALHNFKSIVKLEIIYYCSYILFEQKRKFRGTSQRQENHVSIPV